MDQFIRCSNWWWVSVEKKKSHSYRFAVNPIVHFRSTELVKKCQWEEKWEHLYNDYHTISELKNTKAEGYLFRLEMLVYGGKDVHVLLSDKKDVDIEKDPAYEIGEYTNWEWTLSKVDENVMRIFF